MSAQKVSSSRTPEPKVIESPSIKTRGRGAKSLVTPFGINLLAHLAAVQPMWIDPPEAHLGHNHAQEHHAKRPAQQQ
jgi:hypothetical protein